MAFLDLFRTVLANLNRMRVRVILTAIGVVIGTAAVLVLVSLGVGLQRNATEGIGGISDLTLITVMAGDSPALSESGVPGGRGQNNQPQGLVLETLENIRAIPNVVAVTPQEYVMGGVEMRYNRLTGGGNIVGVEPDALAKLNYKLASGTTTIATGEALVGAQVGGNFYDPRKTNQKSGGPGFSPVGPEPQTVDLQDAYLTLRATRYSNEGEASVRNLRVHVVGVLDKIGEPDFNVYLSLKDVESLNQWFSGQRIDRTKQGYQQAIVKVNDSRRVAEVQRQIRQMGLNAFSSQDVLESINQFFLVLQAVLGGIGAIALLVAAFGIANTLSMAIYERTREIGLMKAIGARNRDVMSIFLGEAAAIGFLGGLAGTALGWGVSGIINLLAQNSLAGQGGNFFGGPGGTQNIVFTPVWLFPFAIAFATLVGLLSGVYPALRAATLDPLKALKYE